MYSGGAYMHWFPYLYDPLNARVVRHKGVAFDTDCERGAKGKLGVPIIHRKTPNSFSLADRSAVGTRVPLRSCLRDC